MHNNVTNRSIISRFRSGFTIIELVVVISVIGILASISIVSYSSWKQSTTVAQLKSDLNGISGALEDYRTFNNTYPLDVNTLSSFTKSSGVTLSGGSTDGGKTYCVDIFNSQFPTLYYNINSTSGTQGAQPGTCGPSNLIATSTSISSISLSWNAKNGASSYALQQDTNSNFSTATTIATQAGITFTSNGLAGATKYYYRVKATIASVDSGWSSSASATTVTPPDSPSAPTIVVTLSGSNVLATINPVAACTTGSLQYGINSRTNDGAWTGWTAWSTTLTATQAANDGVKYGYQAQARCFLDPVYSATSTGSEATYIDPISIPATPTVTSSTVGATTTWSWGAASCPGNSARYQYRYTISPSGYDSGIVATASASVAFTTSTEGQTYTVAVQAECYNGVASSGMSGAGTASYYRPVPQCTLIVASGGNGSVSAGGTYNCGTTQTITATPNAYYSFNSWTGDTGCSGVASHTITVDANKSCTANFTPAAIAAPATPTVTSSTVGATTTWSWGAASCPGNSARYQYRYTISPSGYDSGIVATASASVAFTTSTEGQTYTVAVQAECYNGVASSGMSGAGSGGYYRPVTFSPGTFSTITFTYAGNYQHYVVPAGKTSLVVEVWGAQGGGPLGGNGGYAKGTITVTPGETLRIYVGGQGMTGTCAWNACMAGGFNGGGAGGGSDISSTGYGGGGASDLRRSPYGLVDRLLVGGGGGSEGGSGAGTSGAGGAGGQTGGNAGAGTYNCGSSGGLGGGATQSAGGAGGAGGNECGYPGGSGQGGWSGQGGFGAGCWYRGSGGGGGGYYGGGGSGCPGQHGGGGGSSWIIPSATSITYTTGVRLGNGQITFS